MHVNFFLPTGMFAIMMIKKNDIERMDRALSIIIYGTLVRLTETEQGECALRHVEIVDAEARITIEAVVPDDNVWRDRTPLARSYPRENLCSPNEHARSRSTIKLLPSIQKNMVIRV